MKAIHIVTLFCFIMLTGCRPAASDEVPATFTEASESGLAIGTITFEGEKPYNDIYRFFYEPTEGDKKFIKQHDGKIELKTRVNNQSSYNGDFNNKTTYLFVISRPPGKYAFTQYNYLDHIGSTGMVSTSKEFSIPFEVKKGAITYLGELSYAENAEPGSPRIYIWDRFERDIEQFKQKYSGINWDLAGNNTVTNGNDGGGIILFADAKK